MTFFTQVSLLLNSSIPTTPVPPTTSRALRLQAHHLRPAYLSAGAHIKHFSCYIETINDTEKPCQTISIIDKQEPSH